MGELIPGEQLTREQHRSRRKRDIRARTISVKRMTKRDIELGKLLYPVTDYKKPAKRGECSGGPRPCPFVSCKWHLFLDVSRRTGAIKLNFPDLEVWELGDSCALDVADQGGRSLEDVGAIVNVTRERIRQLEVLAMERLVASGLFLPSPDDFEHHYPALASSGYTRRIDDTESAPGKAAHTPDAEAANAAVKAEIHKAEAETRGLANA